MATFPVLSQGPNVEDLTDEAADDPTLRTEFANGYRLTRNRATVVPRLWKLLFADLTPEDRSAFKDFEADSVGYGGASFSWDNTDDGVTYECRFARPVRFARQSPDPRAPVKRYRAEAWLEECNPAS